MLLLRGASPKPKSGGFIWRLHLLLYQGVFLESTFPSHTTSSLTIHTSLLCQVNDRIWRDQSSFHEAPAVLQQGFGAAFIQQVPAGSLTQEQRDSCTLAFACPPATSSRAGLAEGNKGFLTVPAAPSRGLGHHLLCGHTEGGILNILLE